MRLGAHVGRTGLNFVSGVQEACYENWVLRREAFHQAEDPRGTPVAWLSGKPLDARVLFDASALANRIRNSQHET